jgi:uncharacterized membrane protein HdeD (DUF308 family)
MSANTVVGEVKSRSGWAIFMGILTAALGVFLVVYPLLAAAVTTALLGWVLILAGIAQFVFALYSQQAGQFFWKMLSSLLYGACGVFLVVSPIASLAALTAILGWLLVFQGILQTVVAFQLRPLEGWGWVLFDAACALVLGVMILAKWPSSSAWAIGTLVGVSVFMSGVSRIAIASKIRGGATRVEQFARGHA